MRILLIILVSLSFLSSSAQTPPVFAGMNYTGWHPFPAYRSLSDSSHPNQKWYFSKYIGLSAGFGFFNGGGTTYLSAPVGLQLNRQLNNNLTAFAGVSIAPTFFNYRSAYINPLPNKYYPGNFSNAYGLGMDSRVEMGLMYTNDARTFSISGSIGMDRYSNPAFPAYPPERANTKNRNRN